MNITKEDKIMEEIKNQIIEEEENNVEVEEWRGVLKKEFPDLLLPAEIGVSVIAQLLISDIKNPFALVYVDVPSSGKTITLNFFSNIKKSYTTDNFTPASFVSHSANTKKKDLEANDMLPQIKDKVLIVRDLAPIFAKRDEDVQAMLGILIRVLDGEGLETNSGLYGKRGYVGDYLFMMLSASTPIRPRIWKSMGNLGSRLFFVNIASKEKDEDTLANQLISSCRIKENVCREITTKFVSSLFNKYSERIVWNSSEDNIDLMKIIGKIAKLLARLRSSVNVWEDYAGDKKYNHTQPIKEMPDRLNQLLYNLARGHALACNRRKINLEDIKIVLKVALDSAPPNRSKIFRKLIDRGGKLSTEGVLKKLKCSRPTALHLMKELNLLGIVSLNIDIGEEVNLTTEREITLKKKFEWFISDECQELLDNPSQRQKCLIK